MNEVKLLFVIIIGIYTQKPSNTGQTADVLNGELLMLTLNLYPSLRKRFVSRFHLVILGGGEIEILPPVSIECIRGVLIPLLAVPLVTSKPPVKGHELSDFTALPKVFYDSPCGTKIHPVPLFGTLVLNLPVDTHGILLKVGV